MADQSQIVAEYLAGLSLRQVAAKLGVSKKRVELAVVAAGVARPKSGAETVIDWERAVTMRKAGYGAKAIAKACGGRPGGIRCGLVQRGVWGATGDWGNKTGKASNATGPWAGYSRAEILLFGQLEREHGSWWAKGPAPTRESVREYHRARYYANLASAREYSARKARERHARLKHTPEWKAKGFARNQLMRIARQAKGWAKNCRTIEYLGCTYEEAARWIESQLPEGWTWENYGKVWHIDHVVQLSDGSLLDPAHIARVCHYTNLRPLSAAENLSRPRGAYAFRQSA